jgi:hypothetical protein
MPDQPKPEPQPEPQPEPAEQPRRQLPLRRVVPPTTGRTDRDVATRNRQTRDRPPTTSSCCELPADTCEDARARIYQMASTVLGRTLGILVISRTTEIDVLTPKASAGATCLS